MSDVVRDETCNHDIDWGTGQYKYDDGDIDKIVHHGYCVECHQHYNDVFTRDRKVRTKP